MVRKSIALLLFSSFFMSSYGEVKDSIGQKFVDGKRYVVYKVSAKETLYSLSKQYNTTVAAIEAANGGLVRGLQKGATVLIPVPKAAPQVPVTQTPTTNTAANTEATMTTHVVSAGETLYSISQKYKVSVADLKSWNGLTSNDISLGQELKISKPGANSSGDQVQVNNTDKVNINQGTQTSTIDTNNIVSIPSTDQLGTTQQKVNDPVYTIDTSLYGEEVTETKKMGIISKVGVDQSKNLAQMSGVKSGTILMLVNPANNKATFVRVIEGSAEGILVTNTVKKALGLADAAAPVVKVSYTK